MIFGLAAVYVVCWSGSGKTSKQSYNLQVLAVSIYSSKKKIQKKLKKMSSKNVNFPFLVNFRFAEGNLHLSQEHVSMLPISVIISEATLNHVLRARLELPRPPVQHDLGNKDCLQPLF